MKEEKENKSNDSFYLNHPTEDKTYQIYLSSLVKGNKSQCNEIVTQAKDDYASVKSLYTNLFQKSLYDIGRLWETNTISVAVEHMASAITESLMNTIYADLEMAENNGFKALITCTENEYHQIGAKMVSDIFEMHGWNTWFLGANTPANELLQLLKEVEPHIIAISLSVYFHLPELKRMILKIRQYDYHCPIIIGGQAFNHASGQDFSHQFTDVYYIESLDQLENFIQKKF